MLSTLSCRPIEQADANWLGANPSAANTELREHPSEEGRGVRLSCKSASDNTKLVTTPRPLLPNRTILICLSVGLLVLANLSQCFGASGGHLKYESKEGEPCICNGTFFKSCPKASLCSENKATTNPSDSLIDLDDDLVTANHDYDHPDHVSQVASHPVPERSDHAALLPPLSDEDSKVDDAKQIVRHRKVYVAERKKEHEPIVHPLRLTIPVRVSEYAGSNLPDPKPVYKLRHYKTIDMRPTVKMVPVTKTIIKPKSVTPDQIIDLNDEDRRVLAKIG